MILVYSEQFFSVAFLDMDLNGTCQAVSYFLLCKLDGMFPLTSKSIFKIVDVIFRPSMDLYASLILSSFKSMSYLKSGSCSNSESLSVPSVF